MRNLSSHPSQLRRDLAQFALLQYFRPQIFAIGFDATALQCRDQIALDSGEGVTL